MTMINGNAIKSEYEHKLMTKFKCPYTNMFMRNAVIKILKNTESSLSTIDESVKSRT